MESVTGQLGYPARALSVDQRVEALAKNPEHRTDSLAHSPKVAWSCRPLAAVHSSIAIWRIHPARSPLQVLGPRRSRRRRPLLPVCPYYCSPWKGPAVPTARQRLLAAFSLACCVRAAAAGPLPPSARVQYEPFSKPGCAPTRMECTRATLQVEP